MDSSQRSPHHKPVLVLIPFHKQGKAVKEHHRKNNPSCSFDLKGAYQAAQAAYATATKAQVPEDVQKAELDYAQAKANLDLNQSIVNSRKQLFAEGAIPGRDLDTAKAALVQAKAAHEIAKQHLEAVQKVSHQAALESAQGQLTSAKGKYLGAEALITCMIGEQPIVARTRGDAAPPIGATVGLVWDASAGHVFNAASGARLTIEPSASASPRRASPWPRCSRPTTCRIPASCHWSAFGAVRLPREWSSTVPA